MPPTVVAVGAVATSAAAITPPLPASIAADDILVTVAECEGVTAPGAYTLPAGWAHVTGSPVVQSTDTRLWVIWRRFVAGDLAPSLGDAGDHNVGRMIAIRGCATSGNPWDVAATGVEATSDTSVAWPGVTTTTADCLILECIATSADIGTAQLAGGLTNASYTSIVTQMDNWVITGNGGGIGMVSATKATAGATGSSTLTLATAGFKALMTLALRPAPPGLAQVGVLQRSPRPVEQASGAGPYNPPNPSSILGG